MVALFLTVPVPLMMTKQFVYGAGKSEIFIVKVSVAPDSVPEIVPFPGTPPRISVPVTVPRMVFPVCVRRHVILPGPEESDALPDHVPLRFRL